MIPRRRVPIRPVDFAEWFRSIVRTRRSAVQDVVHFERAVADYLGCAFARATTSGRDAIELAVDAVGIREGDQVIVPAYTLGELLPLLQAKGLELVPADVEPDTFNLDVNHVASRITPRTRAILATHLLGAPCDIEAICEIGRQHGVAVIEDCAHGFGASVSGRKVGTFGDAGIFSLEINKAVPTYGGGVIVTNDPKIAEAVSSVLDARPQTERRALKKAMSTWMEEGLIRSPFYAILARILFSETFARRFEQAYRASHDRIRGAVKSGFTGFQARLGLRRLAELDDRNARLNERWEALAHELAGAFTAQDRTRVGQPAFYNFVVLSTIAPAHLRQCALRLGIDLGIGSEVMDDCGRILGADDCPVATQVCQQAVLLPLYDGLSNRRFRRLAKVLQRIAVEMGS